MKNINCQYSESFRHHIICHNPTILERRNWLKRLVNTPIGCILLEESKRINGLLDKNTCEYQKEYPRPKMPIGQSGLKKQSKIKEIKK